jgi:hypothetical protein
LKVRLWDIAGGKEVRAFSVRPFVEDERIYCTAFSPDGRYVAFGGQMRYLVLYDMATGKIAKRLSGSEAASSLAFSPDGRILACGDWTPGTIRLWEVVTGQEFRQLAGHQGRAFGMAFSADGSLLVTGNEDTTALVWDVTGRRTKRAVGPLDAASLAERWKDLGSEDAARGQCAVGTLAAHPRQAVSFLATHLTPVRAADPKKVASLIADLGSATFKVREQAHTELEPLWETAAPAMRRALARQPSLEARRRLERLLDNMSRPQSPLRLRALRSLQALELIRTAEAGRILQDLAGGASDAWLTREAKAGVARVTK